LVANKPISDSYLEKRRDDLSVVWPLIEKSLENRLQRIRDVSERIYKEELDKRVLGLNKAECGHAFSEVVTNYFTVALGSGKNIENPYQEEFNKLSNEDIECGLLASYLDLGSPYYLTGPGYKKTGYQRLNKHRKKYLTRRTIAYLFESDAFLDRVISLYSWLNWPLQ
jgi:hypothetical protein